MKGLVLKGDSLVEVGLGEECESNNPIPLLLGAHALVSTGPQDAGNDPPPLNSAMLSSKPGCLVLLWLPQPRGIELSQTFLNSEGK